MAETWKLEGTLFDACNCTTLCPCVYFQNPTQSECTPAAAWHIEKGNYGNTNLDGLTVAGVFHANGNPLMGVDKIAMILDEKATPAQREALLAILGGQAGGLFAMLGQGFKGQPTVAFANFEYRNDGKSWSVQAGNVVEVAAGFVKPPPGVPMEASPKTAQTYDPLFAPTMEKVVGISERYRADIGGMKYDLTGKYSSSGRFAYNGP